MGKTPTGILELNPGEFDESDIITISAKALTITDAEVYGNMIWRELR